MAVRIARAGVGQCLLVVGHGQVEDLCGGRFVQPTADAQQQRQPCRRRQGLQVAKPCLPAPALGRHADGGAVGQQDPETVGPLRHRHVAGDTGERPHHGHQGLFGHGRVAALQLGHHQGTAFNAAQERRQRAGCGRRKGGRRSRHSNSIICGNDSDCAANPACRYGQRVKTGQPDCRWHGRRLCTASRKTRVQRGVIAMRCMFQLCFTAI